ncbi:hypothetical protein B0H14DRAFT_3869360 [Mycena olivaceomarginata]|nr:hypothetical protein B0H14DRAFT_3869360 [Mycena olivaceomarginata]
MLALPLLLACYRAISETCVLRLKKATRIRPLTASRQEQADLLPIFRFAALHFRPCVALALALGADALRSIVSYLDTTSVLAPCEDLHECSPYVCDATFRAAASRSTTFFWPYGGPEFALFSTRCPETCGGSFRRGKARNVTIPDADALYAHPPQSTTIPVLYVLPLVLPSPRTTSTAGGTALIWMKHLGPLIARPRCYLDGRPLWTCLRWGCS